jgi:A/G-specific adenine glycosylase
MNHTIMAGRAENITKGLLDWYDENQRDLPWRHTGEPYAVWVSEIMAQQTRMMYLLSYYERFMRRFPTIQSLAESCEDDVLKVWEGLGYYARARNLRKAAQKIMADFNGQLPRTKKELLTLPGIGDYTAGAVLSIAYGLPVPAVDGNVLRVYARLENSDEDIILPQTKKRVADFVTALMPRERAGCFTQALMELGALVCLPKNPNCTTCPIAVLCLARECGRQRELPGKSAKKPPKALQKTVLIIRNAKDQLLMRQRTESLLSGLWEFYLPDFAMTKSKAKIFLQELGFAVKNIKEIGVSKHVFTHQIWHMTGYDCSVTGDFLPAGYRWVHQEDVKNFAIPTAIRFYAEQI